MTSEKWTGFGVPNVDLAIELTFLTSNGVLYLFKHLEYLPYFCIISLTLQRELPNTYIPYPR